MIQIETEGGTFEVDCDPLDETMFWVGFTYSWLNHVTKEELIAIGNACLAMAGSKVKMLNSTIKQAWEPRIKQMCDTIVESNLLKKKDASPTADEIYNDTGGGEAFELFMWYEQALSILSGSNS